MAGKYWSDEELRFVMDNYKVLSSAEIATQLGRTQKSVWNTFQKLGLKEQLPCIGDKLFRLTIDEIFSDKECKQNVTKIKYTCECGKKGITKLTWVKSGKIKSCGCWKADKARETCIAKNTTHNMSYSRLYSIYNSMKAKCTYESATGYHNYGGRGIKVCDEWFQSFENFRDWALANGYTDVLTIDRINSDGNYEPSNCRWATMTEQRNNMKDVHFVTAFGVTKIISEWAKDERCKVNHSILWYRIFHNWEPETAIVTPNLHSFSKKEG